MSVSRLVTPVLESLWACSNLVAEFLDLVAQGGEQRGKVFLAAFGKAFRLSFEDVAGEGFKLVGEGLPGGIEEG